VALPGPPLGVRVTSTRLFNRNPVQRQFLAAVQVERFLGHRAQRLCVDAQNKRTENGTLLQLRNCNGQSNQKWYTA
jgi:hypothetical protein